MWKKTNEEKQNVPPLKSFDLQDKHIEGWFILPPQKRKSDFKILVCRNNFPILPDTPVSMVIYVWGLGSEIVLAMDIKISLWTAW